jgi:glucose-6-phosphate 1-dehydrogenase
MTANPTHWFSSAPRVISPTRRYFLAYERVLSDALAGDRSLFAREDYVEEAWRIVDPVLDTATPIHTYEPGIRRTG